jgi:hypothetical protein
MTVDDSARVAIDVLEGSNGSGPCAVRVAGDGSDNNPSRLVLLRRHADMADETPAADARRDLEHGADIVAHMLSELDLPARSSVLASVIEKAQATFAGSGTYYSILVVVVTKWHVAAAGIGNVSMLLWRRARSVRILNPTTVAIGNTSILSNALGLGYARNRVQRAEVAVSSDDRVLIGVETDLAAVQPMHGAESARSLLHFVVQQLTFERSAIIGVIEAALGDVAGARND